MNTNLNNILPHNGDIGGGGMSMFDLLSLAAQAGVDNSNILPLNILDQQPDLLRGGNLPLPWSINQLIALQQLAEMTQSGARTEPGSDGEVASSCSVSPESKNRLQSISPQPLLQDEPLDLSTPKRMKLSSITTPQNP